MTSAVIIGSEPGTCPCCGGYKISLSDSLNPRTYYLVSNSDFFPALSTRPFPVYVKVDWNFSSKCSGNNHIEITALQTR